MPILERNLLTVHNDISVYIEIDKNSTKVEIIAVDKNGLESRNNFEDCARYVSGKHEFSISFWDLYNLLSTRQSLAIEEILKRASFHKKRIIGFHGKNSLKENIWGVLCEICGTEAKKFARFFHECKGCDSINRTYTNDQFIKLARQTHFDLYSYSDDYDNMKTKVKIFCNTCKTYFYQTPKSHIAGSGCPRCKRSKGEIKIERWLIEHNIPYIWQHSFEDLKYKKLLKLDFYLPDQNTIIEFDGEGHSSLDFYIRKKCKDPEKALRDCQMRDQQKNDYAEKKGIGMLRIPHWDFDVIDITLYNNIIGKVYAK